MTTRNTATHRVGSCGLNFACRLPTPIGEDASYDDGGQKHIYIYTYMTTQERNGCYVTADSYRMANYCNGVQTKSKQVM